MCMLKLSYLMAIVPISVLLTVSFFVLVVLSKIEEKILKSFGYLVVGCLWLAALVVFSGVVSKMTPGPNTTKVMLKQKMKMDCMSKMMQKDSSSAMVMPDKDASIKNEKHHESSESRGNKGVVFKAE